MANDNNVGTAYGFFHCEASKQEIEETLPMIRKLGQIPSELELSLIEGVDKLHRQGDEKLTALAQNAPEKMNYVLQASYPNATNEKTAIVLNDIFVQAYLSDLNNVKERPFDADIAYKENGNYGFLDLD